MVSIIISPLARQDLNLHFEYIAQENETAALTFFDSARKAFADLGRMPELGRLYPNPQPHLQNLRRWYVKGFKKYLIFYRVQANAIEIVRIIYATQDIQSILEKS